MANVVRRPEQLANYWGETFSDAKYVIMLTCSLLQRYMLEFMPTIISKIPGYEWVEPRFLELLHADAATHSPVYFDHAQDEAIEVSANTCIGLYTWKLPETSTGKESDGAWLRLIVFQDVHNWIRLGVYSKEGDIFIIEKIALACEGTPLAMLNAYTMIYIDPTGTLSDLNLDTDSISWDHGDLRQQRFKPAIKSNVAAAMSYGWSVIVFEDEEGKLRILWQSATGWTSETIDGIPLVLSGSPLEVTFLFEEKGRLWIREKLELQILYQTDEGSIVRVTILLLPERIPDPKPFETLWDAKALKELFPNAVTAGDRTRFHFVGPDQYPEALASMYSTSDNVTILARTTQFRAGQFGERILGQSSNRSRHQSALQPSDEVNPDPALYIISLLAHGDLSLHWYTTNDPSEQPSRRPLFPPFGCRRNDLRSLFASKQQLRKLQPPVDD